MQVVDLALGGLDDDLGVDQPGRPHDLLDDLRATPAARRRPAWPTGTRTWLTRSMTSSNRSGRLSAADGQAEPVLDERVLAAAVALVLAVQLRARLTWLSSMTSRKSSGKKSSSVYGGSPGSRPSMGAE